MRPETTTEGTKRAVRLAGMATFLLAALAAGGCGSRGASETGAPEEAASIDVAVAPVAPVVWEAGFEVTAGVEPYRRATPGTILMGRIDRILRREGDLVRSGEVLAIVASGDVAARQLQAEAAASSARVQEQNARQMRERLERLYPKNATSKRSLDDAVAAHESAVAGVAAAEEGVAAVRVQAAYAEVRAPFDGIIAERLVEAGDMAAPGVPFFVIEEVSRLKIEAAVPESKAVMLEAGSPVLVDVEALPGGPREGTIEEILPSADPRSRTFIVRVVLSNESREMRPGMFARLRLGSGRREAMAVPEKALHRRGPLTGLFVVDASGRARLRWVTTGETRDGLTEVLTGLEGGTTIVLDASAPGLADGRPIEASR